jgi:hypothetical protein
MSDRVPAGVNVTDETRHLFRLGVKAFYENEKHPVKRTLREAYRRTIERFFNVGFELINGICTPVTPWPPMFRPLNSYGIVTYHMQTNTIEAKRAPRNRAQVQILLAHHTYLNCKHAWPILRSSVGKFSNESPESRNRLDRHSLSSILREPGDTRTLLLDGA